jgi:cytochrome b561
MTPPMSVEVESPAADDNTPLHAVGQYRLPAKVFHWVTAVLVLFLVSSAVIAKALNDGAVSDTLFALHKLTGVLTLAVVLLRLCYRVTQPGPSSQVYQRSAPHLVLYVTIMLVPMLGWAGVSDSDSREIFSGYSLPPIWPEHAGYADLLLQVHAYVAFGLLALVALHIGAGLQDYMTGAGRSAQDD